jgi:hypothetical protein
VISYDGNRDNPGFGVGSTRLGGDITGLGFLVPSTDLRLVTPELLLFKFRDFPMNSGSGQKDRKIQRVPDPQWNRMDKFMQAAIEEARQGGREGASPSERCW